MCLFRSESGRRIAWAPIALIVVGSYWTAYALHGRLRSVAWELQRSTRRPYLLNGTALLLDRHVSPPFHRQAAEGRYLVLISSDDCPYSHSEAAVWRSLLSSLRFRESDAVLFVSTSGSRTADALAEPLAVRGIAHRRILVTDVAAFAEETGLAWTPHTLALDGDMRIRLSAERCDSLVFELLRTFFEGPR